LFLFSNEHSLTELIVDGQMFVFNEKAVLWKEQYVLMGELNATVR